MIPLRKWALRFRIPTAGIAVLLLLGFYNRFILDTQLRNLKTSLSILDTATGVGQAEAALILVDQALTTQLSQEQMDPTTVATLQYVQGTLAGDKRQRPVEDALVLVAVLGEDRSAARPDYLKAADRVVGDGPWSLRRLAMLPRQIFGRAGSAEVDEAALETAARLERLGRFGEAARIYEGVLKRYPRYTGIPRLKLRLGHLYQQSKDFRRAHRLYRQVFRQSRSPQEALAAQLLLRDLAQRRGKQGRVRPLERRLTRLKSDPRRQSAAFELGTLLLQLNELDQAARAFREAAAASPGGELTPRALFQEGWCLRSSGRLEEALVPLRKLMGQEPPTSWSTLAAQQIAQIYLATGDPQGAAQVLEEAAAKSQDHALTAALYAQMGGLFLFDLNDPVKAQLYLRDLEAKYPASSFSSTTRRLQEQMRVKGFRWPTPEKPVPERVAPARRQEPESLSSSSLAAGTPVMTWLEGFLPVFVDVFSDRLAKYMKAVEEKELTRRFTDVEFRDLVVRHVERRFPGQVSDIQTEIHPNGFVGSGTVHLGILTFEVKARIGIQVAAEKPHAVIQEVKVGPFFVPTALLKILEERVNQSITQARYPLKVKQYELREGYALISVELAEE